MLPKLNRITKDKEFEEIFRFGKSSFNAIIGVKALRKKIDYNKYGIIVSAKISKKATERNKIKRQIREIIRFNLSQMRQGYMVVIICLPKIKEKKFEYMQNSLVKHFRRLGLLRQ